MKQTYTWLAIASIVLASTAGDVMLARAMRQVGDVGKLWDERGLPAVIVRVLRNPFFLLGIVAMAAAFFSSSSYT